MSMKPKFSWARAARGLALAGFALAVGQAFAAQPPAAQPAKPATTAIVAGRDYTELKPAQATETAGKIEVLEFFSYACPHCADFDPDLNAWAKQAPKDVELRRVPITFGNPRWLPLARMYFALEALGELPRLHGKVFHAIHQDSVQLSEEAVQFDWIAKQGIDGKKYQDVYRSFAVQSKLARAQQVAAAYKIQGVPALAVEGKYLVNSAAAGSHAKMLDFTDQLIVKARAARPKK